MADNPFAAIAAAANKGTGAKVAGSLKTSAPSKGNPAFAAAAARRLKKKGAEGSKQEEATESAAEAKAEGDT